MAEFNSAALQGVGIFFIILVNLVGLVRIWAKFGQSPAVRLDDALLVVAYAFYMATSIAFLVNGPLLFRRTSVLAGGPKNPGWEKDALDSRGLFFFTPIGFWITLWTVKASLLSLYKKMMIQLPLYIQLWWAVVAYALSALVVCIVLQVWVCKTVGGWFSEGACSPDRANLTLWVAYAMDISSDVMVMLLPLTLVRNLQMSFGKKISLSLLFCLAFLVIISASIRAVQINEHSHTPLPTWVALWSIIESSVAMIVGCGPGLYFSKHQIPLFSPANRLRETSL